MKKIILPFAMLSLLAGCAPATSSSSSSPEDLSSSGPSLVLEKTELGYTYADFSKNNRYTYPFCPSKGSPKLLVIPVWFTDSDQYLVNETYKANVKEDMEKAFFGNEEDTGWESVASFYKEESKGLLDFEGIVTEKWYESPYSSSQIGANANLVFETVIEAVDWYFENNPQEERISYDLDKNGYIDAVSLIYASPNHETLEEPDLDNLWAYCNCATEEAPDYESPLACTFFWASYDFMYSSSTAVARTGQSYAAGFTEGYGTASPLDTHTYIHEFGHVLGLDDYYDMNMTYKPAGGFSMEDENAGGHDPFSVMTLGWASPYIPTEECSLTIGSFQATHDFILLTPEWNSLSSPFDEYLLLELYAPDGLNEADAGRAYNDTEKGPGEPGIRLWHVDARLAEFDVETQTPNEITVDPYPEGYKVTNAFTNTYYKEGGKDSYLSVYGKEYSDFNLLQLIRNDEKETYRPYQNLKESDLFKDGDTFSMKDFSSQFVKGENLNKDIPLGWSFSVSIDESGDSPKATITLEKEEA